ncbi:TNT domain-containing protein [Caballeronia sp. LP006]|uniref:TNT domain-containing protein n=1 Tax=Caballeronia sp. LP006 TaxID=3038552 RepID=UPI002863092B|nr:TNT domain-containing protein [Caballeronia sp. LP006]MDR5826829.1 TNT domain-containing protein [Caballeronia sp. LP006]
MTDRWVEKSVTLQPGSKVDRYGYEGGSYVPPAGTPYGARALPPGSNEKPYNVYEVTKPIENVAEGRIAPWFGELGLGTQYKLPKSVGDLVESGHLKRGAVNSQELQNTLASLNAPPDSFCIGREKDEALCLVENYGRWSVFYSERGHRTEEQLFGAEVLACTAFLARLRKMLRI